MRIKNSFWAFLSPESLKSTEDTLETIRNTMLNAVRNHCRTTDIHLEFKISYAKDVSELWYLRPELMQALCGHQGETRALALMVDVTTLFVGQHPAAVSSKFKQRNP